MPSNVDQISALQQVLGKKINDRTENSFDLEDQLHATTKQIFIPDLDFGKSGIKQSNLCNELKKRYIPIVSTNKENIHKSLINLNSINMAQSVNEDHLEEPKITLWSAKNVVLGWKEKSYPPGAGFENLGNTCYLNSSIQALFHIPSFVNWLLDETSTHLPNCRNSHNLPFCSICGMMRTLRSSMEPGNSVLKPSLIHDKLKCIGKTLNYGRQEDAHEFIKLLLDHMEKSFLHFKQATRLDHRSKETTPLNQIFGGYLRQQVICPLCRYISTTFFHFQDIVLDIRSATSVEDALNLYFKKETLDSDNAYKCEQCKKRVPATKKYSIERAPHVLLLQLKRFTSGGGKIIKHVSIQKLLDLSKYVNGAMSNSPKGGGPFVYRLASMVIHIGSSQNGGHYTALAQASNSTMFVFDDSLVRPISYQNALTKNPYILFYELIDKKEQVGHKNIVARQSSEKTLINKESNSVKHLSNSYSTNFMCNGNGLPIQSPQKKLIDKKEQVGHKNIVARQSSEKTLINKESNSVKHLSNSYSTNFMCNGNGLPIQSPQKKLIDKKEQVGHNNIVARQSSEKTLINKESNSVKHLSNSYSTNFMCNGNGLPIQSPQKKLIDKKEQVGHKNIVARQSSEKTLINKESNSVKHLSNSYSTNFMCNGNGLPIQSPQKKLIDKKEQVGHKNIVARQSSEKTLINKESNSVKHLSNSYSTNFMCNGNGLPIDKKEQVGHKNIVARQSSEKTLINKESNSVKHLSNSYSTNFMCNGNGLPIDKKEQVGHKNIVARQSSEKTLINKESNSVKHLSNSYSTNFMCNGNVSTWDGGDSHMDEQTERVRLSESRKRNRDDSYNEEIDRGKVRKRPKEDRPSTSRTGENPFQNFQNSFNNESSYERKKSYFPIFNSNNKNNFSDNNEHSNNRSFSKPFQNNFKSGRNFSKFNRNRFNNSHYKWNNSYSHNKHKNFNNKNNYSWFKNGGF